MFKDKVKDKLKKYKEKDIRFHIGIIVIILSIVLCVTLYWVCIRRLKTSVVDLAISFAYYFLFIFHIKDVLNPTVNNVSDIDIQDFLPFSLEEVVRKINEFPRAFFDVENFKEYLIFLLRNTSEICRVLSLLLPALLLIFYVLFDGYATEHKEVKQNTRFERFVNKLRLLYVKVKKLFLWFYEYFKKHTRIPKILLFIWIVNTNVLSIIIEAFAYYFYFVCTFELKSIGVQLGKLVYDLIIMFWTLPFPVWVCIGYVIFDLIRKNVAYKELLHMEARNRGYINTLPIVVLAVGPMGVGKTKTMVDMCLSLLNELRDRALRLMDKNMLRFPEFNFQVFEKDLREQILKRNIKNLATARRYIKELRYTYGRKPAPENIWGYDVKKYPHSYNNGLELVGIWKVLENYAQEFFVYSLLTSSIISNIAIRSDVRFITKGYFETFDADFFKRDPAKIKEESSYSHIIDWDLFRVGCQMNKENAIAGSLEFGVVFASEIGKERQNTLELKELKKGSDEANQKNDLFNAWLKYIRHNATIENECFIYFLADEQRPESWGADARDLASVLHIMKISERELTLHFCFLPLIMEYIKKKYFAWYHKVKKYGNENVYIVSLLHLIVGKLYQRAEYLQNVYGYYTQVLGSESGTEASKNKSGEFLEEHKYFLMCKKIYSQRYSTDAFQDIFAQRTLDAGTSIYEIDTYKSERAILEELNRQNSYQAQQLISLYIPAQVKHIVYKK